MPLNAVDADDHLYLVGGADGQVGGFRHCAELLTTTSVTGLILATPPPRKITVSDISAALLTRVRTNSTTAARVHFGGFSFGAFVATEMARQWNSEYEQGLLLLLDSFVRPGPAESGPPHRGQWYLARDHGYRGDYEEFLEMSPADRVAEVASQWLGGGDIADTCRWVQHLFTTVERNLAALARHWVRPYEGQVGVVVAEDSGTTANPVHWQAAFPAGVHMTTVPGVHADLQTARAAARLAEALTRLMA